MVRVDTNCPTLHFSEKSYSQLDDILYGECMTPEDKIYILRDGQPNEEGPFTINDVLSMYKSGRITSKDKYAMPGSTEWMSVSLLAVAFDKSNQVKPPKNNNLRNLVAILVLVCIFVPMLINWAEHSGDQKTYKPKQAWEYKVVEFENAEHRRMYDYLQNNKNADIQTKLRSHDDSMKSPGDFDTLKISSVCYDAGKEGWEVATSFTTMETIQISESRQNIRSSKLTIIFKRPRQ